MNKIGICLLARSNSRRLPKKALLKIDKVTSVIYLIKRLIRSDYPLVIAIPEGDSELKDIIRDYNVFEGNKENPLKRMIEVAESNGWEHVVRVTHDDLFIDVPIMKRMIKYYLKQDIDYCYTALIPDGCGCEIYKLSALKKAYEASKDINIEGVSHYFRNDNYTYDQYRPSYEYQAPFRLTLDTPNDYKLIKVLTEMISYPIYTLDLIRFMSKYPSLKEINKLNKVTVYIPNYNLSKYVDRAIASVLDQTCKDIEILVIDDCSTDNSLDIYKKYIYPNSPVKFIMNDKNIGLPACANKALGFSSSKYIMRLDADDVLMTDAVEKLIVQMENNDDLGCIYPAYLETNETGITIKEHLPPFNADENSHHPSCCLIKRRCWEDLRYNEELKGYESYEFFKRFKKLFNIGYYEKPLWFKRTREDSMMRTDLEARAKTKKELDKKHG